jgi:hypothetical protein
MRSRLARAVVGALLLGATAADARITLTASAGDTLFSVDTDPNCRELNALPDDALPKNVVRLRADVAGGAPADVRWEWSLPEPFVGVLAADLPLDPNDTTFSLRSMCAEYGNRCLITKEQLPFYNQPTILWIAPTCETALPDATSEQFKGELVTFRVKAKAKKRSLGKSAVKLGYGRLGGVTMFVDHDDGLGRATGIPTDLAPFLSARLEPLPGFPKPVAVILRAGQGDDIEVEIDDDTPPCVHPDRPDALYTACGRPLYDAVGPFRVVAQAELADGSALCDANSLVVQSADNRARLSVETTPRLGTYVPGDPRKGTVNVRVTLFDESLPPNGGLFFAEDAPLTCSTKITLGKLKDTRATAFDFRRCSFSKTQGCNSDGDCPEGQTCLVGPHCSETVARPCETNIDCTCDKICEGNPDPSCKQECTDETCIHVLSIASLEGLGPGRKVLLYEATVDLLNLFPSDAEIEDTWTVTPFNAAPASAVVKYRIKKPKNRRAKTPLGRPRR